MEGRKRKISEVESAEEKAQIKWLKMEAKENEITEADDLFYEDSDCSETSERYEDLSIHNIQDHLRPQEIALLKKDPFGANFRTSVWTNEFTMRRKNHQTSPWSNRDAVYSSEVLPPEVFVEIVSWCDLFTVLKMRRVSMWMNRVIVEDQSIWRKMYYRRHWRLKHDIENNFVGTDPDSVDRSDWTNVIPDNEVDWIEEYRRNHINSTLIRRLFEEIKSKLERIIDEVGVVKEGVTNPMIFEPGVSDEEIDERIMMDGLPITNDLRELMKCCNGAKFWTIEPIYRNYWDDQLIIAFPNLSKLSLGITQQQFYELEDCNLRADQSVYCGSVLEEDVSGSEQLTQRTFNPTDMESDSDDYVTSDQEDSSEESIEENDPCTLDNPINDLLYFNLNVPRVMYYDEVIPAYNPLCGSIEHMNNYRLDDDTKTLELSDRHESIVTYLQTIAEYIDFTHASTWLEFEDYCISDIQDSCFLQIEDHCNNITEVYWHRLVKQIGKGLFHSSYSMTPRVEKLLYAACQDTLTNIFSKAQQLESTDTLRPDTLIAAANHLLPNEQYSFKRNTFDHIHWRGDYQIDITKDDSNK